MSSCYQYLRIKSQQASQSRQRHQASQGISERRHLVTDDCGGIYTLLRSVEHSYTKCQTPIGRENALEIDNLDVFGVLPLHRRGLGAAFQEKKSGSSRKLIRWHDLTLRPSNGRQPISFVLYL